MPINDRDSALLFAFVTFCLNTPHDIYVTSGDEDGTPVSFEAVSSAVFAFLQEYGEHR